MTNADIAAVFERIGAVLNLQGENPFRIRAYDRAAQTIASMSEELKTIHKKGGREALLEIPGIGQDLADKIEELLSTGRLEYLIELQKKVPAGLFDIMEIPGMGPKKTKFVWEAFKVTNIPELEALARSGKLLGIKSWGEKSVENILKGIAAKAARGGRSPLPVALSVAEQFRELLLATKLCQKIAIAGSVRRRKETIGDIDLLVSAREKDVQNIMDAFCTAEGVAEILAKGETKASVRLSNALQIDLRVVPLAVFGAALHYFTGSKEHNVHIRQMGIKKKRTISEWGVYEGTAGNKGILLASTTEEDVYKAVGLPFIEPELREDRGEIEAALRGELPVLINEKDLQGDLHMHSQFSDGSASMTDMAKAAKALGFAYIAITDHASAMGMVRGIKEGNINDYLERIEEARANVPGINILAGAEVDIEKDGSLYLPDSVLKKLDWVVVAVHGHFSMSEEAMTMRILKALDHPYVKLLAHPTSRLLQKRDPLRYDMDAVMKKAAEKGIALEMNASADRMDLNDQQARRAKELGVMLCINSDAHRPTGLDCRLGIMQARRGWLEKGNVLNTKTWKQLEAWLKRP